MHAWMNGNSQRDLTVVEISLMQFCAMLMRETHMVDDDGGLTSVQAQICDYLENGPQRRVIAAFPRLWQVHTRQ